MNIEREHAVRAQAFRWLDEQVLRYGETIPASQLSAGFEFNGTRIPLTSRQGINKPKILDAALSLRTSIDSPYTDHWINDWTLAYRYQGSDPNLWTNQAARLAWKHNLPLIYLQAVRREPRHYVVIYPITIEHDDPSNLAFHLSTSMDVALHGGASLKSPDSVSESISADLERHYGAKLVKTRLHQAHFRDRVLAAYRNQCAMCRLKHPKLLEAAHITPDHDVHGDPVVSNGMSLCRIHHGAFDNHYLAIHPDDMLIHLRPELLEEEDGPMLKHGLQALHKAKLQVPRRVSERPDPERLRLHWDQFSTAS